MQDFQPPFFLRDSHLQSVLGSSELRRRFLLRRAGALLAIASDEIVDCGAGVRLLLHHSPPVRPESAGVAILIHGWEGSGQATYVMSASVALWQAGARVIRMNLRDHGNSHHLNPELFHSCRLDEVVGAVQAVHRRFPEEPLVLAGFSLGGNFALRVAAAAPQAGINIRRVAAVCPVLDPVATMYALDNGQFFYRWYFLRKWRRSLLRKAAAFPGKFDFGDLRRFRTLQAMTEFFVRRYTEFDDLFDYLNGYALTGERLADLQIPSRMLLAEDDPVIPVTGIDNVARTSALQVERTRFGGHCAFLNDYRLTSLADSFLLDSLVTSPETRSAKPSLRQPGHFRTE